MLNFSGSLRYDMHGRKRRTKALSKPKRKNSYMPNMRLEVPKREDSTKKYRSMPIGSYRAQEELEAMKKRIVAQQESAKYTVAPAYNKGAYQVIPRKEVKDIGR